MDHLSVILATNAESIRMPKEWLLGSLHNIRRLGEDPATREKMEAKQLLQSVAHGQPLARPRRGVATMLSAIVAEEVEGSFENILTSMLESALALLATTSCQQSSSETTSAHCSTAGSAAMQTKTMKHALGMEPTQGAKGREEGGGRKK